MEYVGAYSEQNRAYASSPEDDGQYKEKDEEEQNGPPRGFFYSFDYPVGIITKDQGKLLQKREEINNLYDRNKAALEQQLRTRRAVVLYV